MNDFSLHDLKCFDAVIRTGSFQAAAAALHRSHPAVFAAVARLESEAGLNLLDRGGYRVKLSDAGRSFHERMQPLLSEAEGLRQHAAQLAMGEESELHVVLGDLCPRPAVLGLLARFFTTCVHTRLHLHFETVSGPVERLKARDADLMFHRVDATDPLLESIALCKIRLVPVIAPNLLPAALPKTLRPEHLRDYTQCVMRDSARAPRDEHFLVIEGAHQITVADQFMKKDVILQGLAWGHLPDFLIDGEIRHGTLRSIAGRYFPGRTETVVAARRRDGAQGPVAERLWAYLQANAPIVASGA
ncbi:LysR family transcriptional regulator [Paraburkholderia ginsengisoli]|uniref:LysR family transcriptional regulator n=1 Tax=Paraburkholderia ginsengisoli TaxID=311231 RepID=A0A7T4TA56_9BURK|nr:LysR family transcriptional regulator [Paraburkholderia ginsengisoli]QQC65747.1 LysR family transcriptional regulator [Paraburkholderia ginsengisoli]